MKLTPTTDLEKYLYEMGALLYAQRNQWKTIGMVSLFGNVLQLVVSWIA